MDPGRGTGTGPGVGIVAARVAVASAAAGPPVAVAGVWRDAVVDRPVFAMVLLGGYEILVFMALFAGRIAAGLRERWEQRIVNCLDRALVHGTSRFDRRYREFMLASLRFIDLKGLATIGFYTPELDEVFVDVSLAPREPNQASGSLLAVLPAEVTERHSLGEFLDRPQPVVLAVIGVPGSGKTTLLRYTARQVCRTRRGRRRTVPILLYLRDHVTVIVSTPDVALPELICSTLGRHGPDEPDGWFKQRLHDGDCVVLLDGLDEVARPEERKGVADWVERQIRQYPKNDYVITSRPQGYRTARIDGAAVLQIRSFTDEQVTRFVQGWYLAVERHSTGATGQDVVLRAEAAADDLLRRLDAAPALYDLTVNPLLLTMIAIVHRHCGALPGSRADLYGQICQAMLWRRQEAKDLPVMPEGKKKEVLLRGLAFAMMRRQVGDLPRADVLTEIRPGLRRISRQLTAEEFLVDIASNGLLIERESGRYSFAHQTFQEYLAATHISAKGLADVLVDAVDDVWWRETTLLYTAQSDADPIVQACLASSSVTALSLAFDCDNQGSELAPELRDRLDELLAAAFAPDTDPERRRLVAGVLLTRHLRQLIPTSNGGRVCARPITTDLYQLYRHDTQGSAAEGAMYREPGSEKPVIGVSGIDAAGFAVWASSITGSDTVYRLPRFSEIDDSALRRVLTVMMSESPAQGVWLEPDHEQIPFKLWVPSGADHPHLIDAATLASHVQDDIKRSIPTLTRLLLLRSIITVHVITSALDRTRARARALDLDLGLGLGLDLDRDLARALDVARARDVARDRDLDRVLDLDCALDVARDVACLLARARARSLHRHRHRHRELARDLARDLDRELALARDRARDLGRACVLTRPLARDHAHTLDLDRDLVLTRDLDRDLALVLLRALALDLARARDLDRDLARDLARDLEDIRSRVMGRALASVLAGPLHRNASVTMWPAEFAREFVNVAGVAKADYIVAPDTLADRVRSGHQGLTDLLGWPDPWTHQVARNLQEIALPVFSRQQPLTTETATAIRLAALCLAVEADIRQAHQLGDTFREIAAGVTLLERCAKGQAVLTETIMLAIT
ncbi:MAG: NACHT domain-containing protein [Pseudonocardiaceae bacterium]